MTKRLAVGVSAVLLAGAVALLIATRHLPAPAVDSGVANISAPAVVATPESFEVPSPEFLGVVVAHTMVDLSAKFDSHLSAVQVQIGDSVRRGTRIATLDVRSVRQDLTMAEAGLRAAEAEHEQATLELADSRARLERLIRLGGLVSAEQVATGQYQTERAGARLAQVGAQIAERRARVDQLLETTRDADVRAPFDGVIAARYLDPGSTVARGAPIVRIISPDALWVRFAVPEARASEITVGQPIVARLESPAVALPGTVARVAPDIDNALQMFVVEAALTPGAAAQANVPAGAVARVSVRARPDLSPH